MVADRFPPEDQRIQERERKMLMAEDIAETVRFILSQPPRVVIDSIKITPAREDS